MHIKFNLSFPPQNTQAPSQARPLPFLKIDKIHEEVNSLFQAGDHGELSWEGASQDGEREDGF